MYDFFFLIFPIIPRRLDIVACQSLKIHHSTFAKIIAILLIISMTLLFIPFPIEAAWQPVNQSIDSFVEMLDHIDGHNNFTPGAKPGENIIGKISDAFGGN